MAQNMVYLVMCAPEEVCILLFGGVFRKCQFSQVGYSVVLMFYVLTNNMLVSIIERSIATSDCNCRFICLYLLTALSVIAY